MARTDRPNVVVFLTDQQRWDSTGTHGNPLGLTPNFDDIAASGTHVATSITCQPVCAPARGCLQTGRYATNHGVFRNAIALPPEEKTLADYFGAAGYSTGYIGKWHLADAEPVPEAQRGGYQYWLGANAIELVSDGYDTIVYDQDNRRVKLPGYRVDALTDAAIRYIDGHQAEPFFLFLSILEPHQQNHREVCVPPRVYRDRYQGRWTPPDLAALVGSAPQQLGPYWGSVKRIDEAFGRLLDTLESLQLQENTIVLFTSDHGCHFKTREGGYKRSCHESSVRVPTVLTGPGFFGGGQVRELIGHIDLPPTLLDAAGLPVPATMEGRSFLPLLRGERAGWPDDVFIQISESQVGRAIRTKRWKYAVVAPDADGNASPDAERYEERYLYDLEDDPYELSNLIGLASHREVAGILRQRLLRRMVAAGEREPVITATPAERRGPRRVTTQEAAR
jgi:arylsulfatase A-like enzyme